MGNLPPQVKSAKEMRQRIREHMDELLSSDAVLAVPAAPGPAPILNTPQNKLATYRKNMLSLTSIAGLAGLPQVSNQCLGLLGETAHQIAAGYPMNQPSMPCQGFEVDSR